MRKRMRWGSCQEAFSFFLIQKNSRNIFSFSNKVFSRSWDNLENTSQTTNSVTLLPLLSFHIYFIYIYFLVRLAWHWWCNRVIFQQGVIEMEHTYEKTRHYHRCGRERETLDSSTELLKRSILVLDLLVCRTWMAGNESTCLTAPVTNNPPCTIHTVDDGRK